LSNRFAFTGLEELKQALRSLPDDLSNEAGVIVQQHAYTAAQAIRDAYSQHRVTGFLADHVVVEQKDLGRFGVGMVVRNKSPHAWWFENGTQARHYTGAWKTGKLLGKMPARPTFIPIMMRFRASMWTGLAELLRQHGLTVTGTVDRAA
jgi:hypothetical protein